MEFVDYINVKKKFEEIAPSIIKIELFDNSGPSAFGQKGVALLISRNKITDNARIERHDFESTDIDKSIKDYLRSRGINFSGISLNLEQDHQILVTIFSHYPKKVANASEDFRKKDWLPHFSRN